MTFFTYFFLDDELFDLLLLDDKYLYAFYFEFLKNSIDF